MRDDNGNLVTVIKVMSVFVIFSVFLKGMVFIYQLNMNRSHALSLTNGKFVLNLEIL